MKPPSESSRRQHFSVGRYIATFVVVLLVFEAWFLFYAVDHPWFEAYLRGYASISGALLGLLGHPVEVVQTTIRSAEGAIAVRRGCDAFQPAALLCANVLAFPATARQKLIGLGVGISVILVLNLARIVSLYWFAASAPEYFESWHVTVWPVGFIGLSLGIWFVWARWTAK